MSTKESDREYNRRYAATERAKEKKRAWQRSQAATEMRRRQWADPEFLRRFAAHRAIAYCISRGWLVRPETCQRCDSRRMIEGHHHDYSKPLEVEWLCRDCHKAEHR